MVIADAHSDGTAIRASATPLSACDAPEFHRSLAANQIIPMITLGLSRRHTQRSGTRSRSLRVHGDSTPAATKGPSGWPAQCHVPDSHYGNCSGDCSWSFGSHCMTQAISCSLVMAPGGGFGQPTWPRHCSGFPPRNWKLSRSKMNSALTCWSIVRTDRESE
jgi:hypothetical protein